MSDPTLPATAGDDPLPPTSGGSFIWDTATAGWVPNVAPEQPETNPASAEPSAADQAEEHE